LALLFRFAFGGFSRPKALSHPNQLISPIRDKVSGCGTCLAQQDLMAGSAQPKATTRPAVVAIRR